MVLCVGSRYNLIQDLIPVARVFVKEVVGPIVCF